MGTANEYRDSWYEEAMGSREREFAALFGPTSPPGQVFKSPNEGWETTIPGFAFLRYAPTPSRNSWIYVTHGLAQPPEFEDFQEGFDGGVSGMGIEFALATSGEESWPFTMLEMMASYALKGSKVVMPLDRIPASDLMEEACGGHLLVLDDPGYKASLTSLSGTIRILHLVGVTSAEIKNAKAYPGERGSKILELVLCEFGVGCVTDRRRECLTHRSEFKSVWHACELEYEHKE